MVCGPTGWGESLGGSNNSAQGFDIPVYAQTLECLSPPPQVGLLGIVLVRTIVVLHAVVLGLLDEDGLLVHRSDEVQELPTRSFEDEPEDDEHECDGSEHEVHDQQDESLVGVLLEVAEVVHRHEGTDRQVGEHSSGEPQAEDAGVGKDGVTHGYSWGGWWFAEDSVKQ